MSGHPNWTATFYAFAGPFPALFRRTQKVNGGIAVRRLAIAFLFLTVACHHQSEAPAAATDTATTSTMVSNDTTGTNTGTGSTGGTASTLSDADKSFVMKAAQGGMAEVALGNLAAQQGASADVKSF